MRDYALGIALAILAGGTVPAVPEPPATAQTIDKEIKDLDTRIDSLEKQREEAERRKEALAELREICEAGEEWLEGYRKALNDLLETGEEPATPSRNALVKACREHIAACRALNAKLQALRGTAALPEARRLNLELELLECDWDLSWARYERAHDIDLMEREARKEEATKALLIIPHLRALHKEDVAAAEREHALRRRRLQLARRCEELAEEFWRVFEGEAQQEPD